jgi:hypothetical protein
MNPDRKEFLNLRHLPARLNAEETGWYLGFTTLEIPHLAKARLLKPLGKSNRFTKKYYATVRLRRLRDNESWLNRASEVIFKFWQDANEKKTKNQND